MGKTKTKIIDDSAPEEVVKTPPVKKEKKEKDSLVAKLNAELGIEEESKEEVIEAAENDAEPKKEEVKKVKKPKQGKEKPRSKKYQEVSKDLDRDITYPLTEAIDLVKKMSYSKFNGTLEAHINTAQTGIRGLVSLPYASGKLLRILVFGTASKELGDVTFGDDETIEEIIKKGIDFDLVITTPEWMPKLAKVARILGPRSLMPNPKNGTITSQENLKSTIESFQAGKTEYKTEAKAPVIHLGLGKMDQPTEELSLNVKTLLQTIGKSRVKKVSLSPTMGPSVKLDLSSI